MKIKPLRSARNFLTETKRGFVAFYLSLKTLKIQDSSAFRRGLKTARREGPESFQADFPEDEASGGRYAIVYSEWRGRYWGELGFRASSGRGEALQESRMNLSRHWLWWRRWRGEPRTVAALRLPARADRLLADLSRASRSMAAAPVLTREIAPAGLVPARPAHFGAARPFAGDGERLDLSVAAVMDPFSYQSFAPEANFRALSALDAARDLESAPPDFLFVESAWSGGDGSWRGRLSNPRDPALGGLLRTARRLSVPVVFWNKEDPVHFRKMSSVAGRADAVFTTDAEMIPAYRRLMGGPAEFLHFPIQPALHNPVGRPAKAPREIFFAGTYNGTRYPARMERMKALFAGAMERDFVIFDRMLGSGDPQYWFPEAYHPFLAGSLDFRGIAWATRFFEIGLNVNTVERSPTMCSRRIAESLACGAHVVSGPSLGAAALFGRHIRIAATADQAREAVEEILTPRPEAEAERARMIRATHSEYASRLHLLKIAKVLGLSAAPAGDADLLARVGGAEDWASLGAALRGLKGALGNLTALATPEAPAAPPEGFPHPCGVLRLSAEESSSPGGISRALVRAAAERGRSAAFGVLVWRPEALRPSLLVDAVNALRYAQADLVGRAVGSEVGSNADLTPDWLGFRWSAAPRLRLKRAEGGGLRVSGGVSHALRAAWDVE